MGREMHSVLPGVCVELVCSELTCVHGVLCGPPKAGRRRQWSPRLPWPWEQLQEGTRES